MRGVRNGRPWARSASRDHILKAKKLPAEGNVLVHRRASSRTGRAKACNRPEGAGPAAERPDDTMCEYQAHQAPYKGESLPALYTKAPGVTTLRRIVVVFDGMDEHPPRRSGVCSAVCETLWIDGRVRMNRCGCECYRCGTITGGGAAAYKHLAALRMFTISEWQ